MIPNNNSAISHSGNMAESQTEAVQFGIDQTSIAHIMSLLTDLYSDRAMAVIREYSTNSLDSHIAAGVDEPIEIELPTRWNASLVVRDHGLGMSKEDIERIYGQYGHSTKRDTNTQNGMLGLGSKSALTYTSQFTLVGIKDGLRTTVLITRNEEGVGVLQFIGEPVATDERNGVEITIPVTDTHEMRSKAVEFFQYWEPGTVLVDGEQPESIFAREDALVVEEDTIILLPVTGYRRNSRIVMAGVAYPFTLTGPVADHFDAVVKVETGAVTFTPSREALMENPLTNDTVATVQDFVNRHFIRMLQEQLDACETPIDAIRMFHKNDAMRAHKIDYRGTKVKMSGTAKGWRWNQTGYSTRANQVNGNLRFMELLSAGLIVVGAPRPTATMKNKARHYITMVGRPVGMDSSNIVYFLEDNPGPGWLDKIVVSYDDIKKVELPKVDRPKTTQPKTKFRIWNRYADLEYVDDLPEGAQVIWVAARSGLSDHTKSLLMAYIYDHHRIETGTCRIKNEFVVVDVLKRKTERFLKDHPDAITPQEFVTAEVAAIEGQLTPLMAWRRNGGYDRPWVSLADLRDVPDPDLARLMGAMDSLGSNSKVYEQWSDLTRLCSNFGIDGPTEPDMSEYVNLYRTITERYPWLFGYRNTPPVAWMLKAWYYHTKQEEMLDQMMVTNDYIIPVDLTKRKP